MADAPTIQSLARQVYFSPMQRSKVRHSIDHLEHTIRSAHSLGAAAVAPNIEMLEANLERDKQMLANGTPPEYDGRTRNKLFALRKELIETITNDEDFLTHDEMERPTPTNQSRLMRFERRQKKRVLAIKSINRILDPTNDDIDFCSVFQWRDDTRPQGNPRNYWHGFDGVEWETALDKELAENLDDGVYYQFLELKSADWAAANIMRKLGISDRVYAACMQRLNHVRQPDDADDYGEDGDEGDDDDLDPRPSTDTHVPVLSETRTHQRKRHTIQKRVPRTRVAPPAASAPPDRSASREATASAALGVPMAPVKQDKPKRWPSSELTRLDTTLTELARRCEIPYMRMMSSMGRGTFKPEEVTVIERVLGEIEQEYHAKRAPQGPSFMDEMTDPE